MNTATFDTLSAARSLEAAGIESKQAEAIVGAIRSSGEASVTKADLTASTTELRGAMNELRGEMKAMAAELRGEISSAVNKMLLAPTRHCRIAVCGNQGLRLGMRRCKLGATKPVPVSDSPVVGLLQVLSGEHGRISHAASTRRRVGSHC